MLDVETDLGHGDAEENGEGQGLPPCGSEERQSRVGGRECDQNNSRLEIHARAIALRSPCGLEELLDAPPEFGLKIVGFSEFQSFAGFFF